MRRWTILALALFVGFGIAGTADAKKPKPEPEATEGGTTDATAAAATELTIQTCGVADVDSLFTKANAPIENIKAAHAALDSLSTQLNTALGLPAGTPFKDAFADLKTKAEGKVQLAIDAQGMPSLKPGDAVPANVQAAIDAVNTGLANVKTTVEKLSEVPQQMTDLVNQAKAINPASLTGVNPTQVPKVTKAINNNVKVLTDAPVEVKGLMDAFVNLKNDLQASFSAG